ncbi:hypothetical protein KTT_41290 [Tengunoibacter tsumagoiensis]|uniref:SWIM-type domain-containing protein n=2 Tax=Tengunoibacter tsumagoiensis TaxID=2014871 RepID=A0A402A582_9CHLR|nr:hypothetical protein KTT_40750 [Tengunoibacter tsumagoiensis]GCE14270.1 hypothetical protein KTT_41290 [Tengunoibacter tsumagoiensis]
MVVQGTNGAEVHLRFGDVFYLIRSASLGDNMFYVVLADARGAKKCSCPARKPCKHEIKVSDLVAARPSEQRAISSLPTLLPTLTPRQQERIDLLIDVYPDGPSSDPRQAASSIEERGSLNGSRAFSILR